MLACSPVFDALLKVPSYIVQLASQIIDLANQGRICELVVCK